MRALFVTIIMVLALACGYANAQVAPNSPLYQPAWRMAPYGINPTSDCYWAKSLYYGNCTLNVSRASVGTYSDSSGNWYTAANNVARIGNGTGVWVEEARTNSIRNNTMQGAVVGTPGTSPTNWSLTGAINNLTQTIVAVGSQNGIATIDLQLNGTPSSTGSWEARWDTTTQIAASSGQTWGASFFYALVGGSLSNTTVLDVLDGFNGSSVTEVSTNTITPSAVFQRDALIRMLNNAGTTSIFDQLQINYTSGKPVNITIRIGWPQLELNPLINSTVASATVNAGGTLYTPSSSGTVTWSGSGCTTNPVLNVTTSGAGVINAVTSVATAGSCTTFPSSSATTWTDGTGLGTGSGASFNLVPVNNAAQGFATSPIPTTNAAVTRAADVITYTSPGTFCPGGYSMVAWGTPFAPVAYPNNQSILSVSDGTSANRIVMFRTLTTGDVSAVSVSGGTATPINLPTAVWAQNTSGKIAMAISPGRSQAVFDGLAAGTAAPAATPISPNQIQLGLAGSGAGQYNGTIARSELFNCTVLPAAALQSATNPNLYNYLLRGDVLPDAGNDNRPMWLEYVA